MSAYSRRKGANGERELVALARAAGLDALRTWETAQSLDAAVRCCDVRVEGKAYQVKRQRDGFGALYDGLKNVTGLFLRSDGRVWLAVVPASDYFELL